MTIKMFDFVRESGHVQVFFENGRYRANSTVKELSYWAIIDDKLHFKHAESNCWTLWDHPRIYYDDKKDITGNKILELINNYWLHKVFFDE